MTTDQIGFLQPSIVKVNPLQWVFSQWFLSRFQTQVKNFTCPGTLYSSFFLFAIILVFSSLERLLETKVNYALGFAGGSQLAGQ